MKKLLITLALAVSFNASAWTKDDCEVHKQFAGVLQMERQTGTPMFTLMNELGRSDDFINQLVFMAYNVPVYQDVDSRMEAVRAFKDLVYDACMDNVRN